MTTAMTTPLMHDDIIGAYVEKGEVDHVGAHRQREADEVRSAAQPMIAAKIAEIADARRARALRVDLRGEIVARSSRDREIAARSRDRREIDATGEGEEEAGHDDVAEAEHGVLVRA